MAVDYSQWRLVDTYLSCGGVVISPNGSAQDYQASHSVRMLKSVKAASGREMAHFGPA